MRASTWLGVLSLLALAGCGGTGGGDAGADAGPVVIDSGTDSGPRDSGLPDAGMDAGPPCTTGCAYVELGLLTESSCARRENGEVRCWGRAQEGELGDGIMSHAPGCRPVSVGGQIVDCSARPTSVALGGPALRLEASGGPSACALVGTEVWCWGEESFAIGGTAAHTRLLPELYPTPGAVSDVSDGFLHVCTLLADGTPTCAGNNGSGQLGQDDFMDRLSPQPVLMRDETAPTGPPIPLTGVLELRTSTSFGSFSCARTATQLYCWGNNESTQLGTGSELHQNCTSGGTIYDCSLVAVPVTGIDATMIVELRLGQSHACARLSDGTVQCWGDNQLGQLGLGDALPRATPTPLGLAMPVAQLALGAHHTCLRMMDGTVRCAGTNDEGQLGDGLMDHGMTCTVGTSLQDCSTTFTTVSSIADATFLDTGRDHNCAIRASGEIWCWGANDKLQLGDGPVTTPTMADRLPRFSPVMVQGL